MVDPHDLERVTESTRYAFHLDRGERRRRVQARRASVRRNDIQRWVDRFLDRGQAPGGLHRVERYSPPLEARPTRPAPVVAEAP